MDAKIKQDLSSVFDARAQQAAAFRVPSSASAPDRAAFVRLRDEVIHPALEEVAAYLVSRGQPAHVALAGREQNTVELALFAADAKPRPLSDRFCFIYDEARGALRMYVHQAEQSQPYGAPVALADVSPSWVQQQFTTWFVSIQPAGVNVKAPTP